MLGNGLRASPTFWVERQVSRVFWRKLLTVKQAGGKEESAQGVGVNVAEVDAAVSFAKEYLASKSN